MGDSGISDIQFPNYNIRQTKVQAAWSTSYLKDDSQADILSTVICINPVFEIITGYLSFRGARTKMRSYDHILMIHKGIAFDRRLHSKHIQGSLVHTKHTHETPTSQQVTKPFRKMKSSEREKNRLMLATKTI